MAKHPAPGWWKLWLRTHLVLINQKVLMTLNGKSKVQKQKANILFSFLGWHKIENKLILLLWLLYYSTLSS